MNKVVSKITLDLERAIAPIVIQMKQGDKRMRAIEVLLVAGSEPWTLDGGYNAVLYAKLPNKTIVTHDMTVSEDRTVLSCNINSNWLLTPGEIECEVRIIGAMNGYILNSPRFSIYVTGSLGGVSQNATFEVFTPVVYGDTPSTVGFQYTLDFEPTSMYIKRDDALLYTFDEPGPTGVVELDHGVPSADGSTVYALVYSDGSETYTMTAQAPVKYPVYYDKAPSNPIFRDNHRILTDDANCELTISGAEAKAWLLVPEVIIPANGIEIFTDGDPLTYNSDKTNPGSIDVVYKVYSTASTVGNDLKVIVREKEA